MEPIIDHNLVSSLAKAEENKEVLANEAQEKIEEIDASPVATIPGKSASISIAKKAEPIPNPLLEDPYEWDRCTITMVYALQPDQSVTVSVYNHKDEPIIRSFVANDIHLPEKIGSKVRTLQAIWPDATISATLVFLPKPAEATERALVISVRAGTDTPIVLTDLESNIAFPPQINAMLVELRALLPSRALKKIERDAKTKITPKQKSAAKAHAKTVVKPATVASTIANKSQLSLF